MRLVRHRPPLAACRNPGRLRRGATAVEFALVSPVLFLTMIGLVVLGLGIFRYNQVAALAHAGARWASVHGKNYDSRNHRSSAVTSTDLYNEVIKTRAVGFDPSKLTYNLTWSADRRTVAVTVNYRWLAEAYFGEVMLTSTSNALVSN